MPANDLEPLREDHCPELTAAADPALRLLGQAIRTGDEQLLRQLTGFRRPEKKELEKNPEPIFRLPVVIELSDGKGGKRAELAARLQKDFNVPPQYQKELEKNHELRHVTGVLNLDMGMFSRSVDDLQAQVAALRSLGVRGVALGGPGQPSRRTRDELRDIGVPADRKYNGHPLTGEGVVIGIIDDGCALAHPDFLKPRVKGVAPQSRILWLWDQAGDPNAAPGWSNPAGFGGREIDQAGINAALAARMDGDRILEDGVHEDLGYRIQEVSTHGSHVMDIAAGTGQSLMGSPGVAPGADIIFVQLPSVAIEQGATVLWHYVISGVLYILQRAGGKPVVVNVSYGGYDGPHDGTSDLEATLDALLAQPNRAVVLAAGNAFEARCHATKKVKKGNTDSLRWICRPCDSTANTIELWYPKSSSLQVRLRPPSGEIDPSGWIALGQSTTPITRVSDGKTIGYIEHLPGSVGNGDSRVVITLNATQAEPSTGVNATAPSGVWSVDLKNVGAQATQVHAWIWRDDSGRPSEARRRQSRFHPDDAHPASSIAGWATGRRTINVGAFNTATAEVCRYSACGPTRDGRAKPDIYAPAEDTVRGNGVLSASARSARPSRMNGTSASAPYVTGMIALMFEYAKKYARGAPVQLDADAIVTQMRAAARAGKLKFNRHQKIDARVRVKQRDVRPDLLSTEIADFIETMKKLPQ